MDISVKVNKYYAALELYWPSELRTSFVTNYSSDGSFIFEPGSPEEVHFVQQCIDFGLASKMAKVEHVGVPAKGLANTPEALFYFSVSSIDYSGPAFLNLDTGCTEPTCRRGMIQLSKVTINPNIGKRLDICTFRVRSSIFWIVTRRAKEVIESAELTGCTFVPCLRTDRKYTAQEMAFEGDSASVKVEAEHFQMLCGISTHVNVGKVHISEYCPRCGTARVFYNDIVEGHSPKINCLADSGGDFLWFDERHTSDGVVFHTWNRFYTASGRALDTLLKNNVKGVDRSYSKNPKIEFGLLPFE